nr:hypothetical protein [Desulfonatronum sp. SC1]
MHTICAIANDFNNFGGGYLVVGVEERDGRPGRSFTLADRADLMDVGSELAVEARDLGREELGR